MTEEAINEQKKEVQLVTDWFLEVRKEFPQAKVTKGDRGCFYFHGNKVCGSEYELNTWKGVPMVQIQMAYGNREGLRVDCDVNFVRMYSASEVRKGKEVMQEYFRESFRNCVRDFLEEEV